jgi:hypothetical protein
MLRLLLLFKRESTKKADVLKDSAYSSQLQPQPQS